MIYKSILAALVVTALGAAPGAVAAEKAEKGKDKAKGGEASAATGQIAAPDQEFASKAAVAGLAEVQHGKLAQKKGTSDQVKEFGKQMVADHTKANDELKSLAKSKGITLPKDLDAKHKAMQEKLGSLEGEAFDKAYSAHMVDAHKEAVALFERGSKSAQDPDLKAWAAKTLPTLQAHLDHAKGLPGSQGSAGKKSK